ncbi:ankyrin repeat domain-containing protein [Nostoc sp.]|uniref:ankyrin repeat domain-containing protein n=1 Tax=Nostoc sp. TaxID=1180 RepID=UPI002FFA894B
MLTTALIIAAKYGASDCVRILLEAGANLSRINHRCMYYKIAIAVISVLHLAIAWISCYAAKFNKQHYLCF